MPFMEGSKYLVETEGKMLIFTYIFNIVHYLSRGTRRFEDWNKDWKDENQRHGWGLQFRTWWMQDKINLQSSKEEKVPD